MDAQQRLSLVESALTQRGMRDVKFCLAKGVVDNSASDVSTKVAAFLESFLAGNSIKMENVDALN